MFLEDAPGLPHRMEICLANPDLVEARRAAHSLKGLAANLGAERAVAAATEMEQALCAWNRDEVRRRLALLRDRIDQVIAGLPTDP